MAARQIAGPFVRLPPQMPWTYVRRARRAVKVPLAVKLTAQADDPLKLARVALDEGADMLVLTGRVPGFMPDIETYQPVLGSWGAIGGAWAFPASLYWVSKCRRTVSSGIPIIGTNGARSAEDVLRSRLAAQVRLKWPALLSLPAPRFFRK